MKTGHYPKIITELPYVQDTNVAGERDGLLLPEYKQTISDSSCRAK